MIESVNTHGCYVYQMLFDFHPDTTDYKITLTLQLPCSCSCTIGPELVGEGETSGEVIEYMCELARAVHDFNTPSWCDKK